MRRRLTLFFCVNQSMSNELIHLIVRGRNHSFHDEVTRLRENDEPVSIEGATFKNLNLQRFRFDRVDMTNVEFDGCTLDECIFDRCNVEGTYITGTNLLGCVFNNLIGDGFALDTCTMTKGTFSGGEICSCEWSDTSMTQMAFDKIAFTEALWERITLTECTLTDLTIKEGELSYVTLRQGDVAGLTLEDCEVDHCYGVKIEKDALPKGFGAKSGARRKL